MPPHAPTQEFLIDALADAGKGTDTYRAAQALSAELSGPRGIDYIFAKHNLDAAVFAVDLGAPQTFTVARGYAGVSEYQSYADEKGKCAVRVQRGRRAVRDLVCGQVEGGGEADQYSVSRGLGAELI